MSKKQLKGCQNMQRGKWRNLAVTLEVRKLIRANATQFGKRRQCDYTVGSISFLCVKDNLLWHSNMWKDLDADGDHFYTTLAAINGKYNWIISFSLKLYDSLTRILLEAMWTPLTVLGTAKSSWIKIYIRIHHIIFNLPIQFWIILCTSLDCDICQRIMFLC